MGAKLEFFHGVMGSGKGVFVAQMVHNTERREITPITMKPGIDSKGGDFIVSRIGTEVPVDIMAAQANAEKAETDVYEAVMRHLGRFAIARAHLIVDEVQFFSATQIDQLHALTLEKNLPVTCFGLRTDVYRNLFAGSKRLIELSQMHTNVAVHELQTAIRCAGCPDKPEHNGRYVNGLFDIDSTKEVVRIDGADEKDDVVYDVFCTSCYEAEVEKSRQGILVVPHGI